MLEKIVDAYFLKFAPVCAPGTVGTMAPMDQLDKLTGFINAQEACVQV
jgi:hypothetical protein